MALLMAWCGTLFIVKSTVLEEMDPIVIQRNERTRGLYYTEHSRRSITWHDKSHAETVHTFQDVRKLINFGHRTANKERGVQKGYEI